MCPSTYKHFPLPASPLNAIRLLRVRKALVDGLISCDIRLATPEEPHICLSYTWGSEDDQQDILLDGQKMRIRLNLWNFLQVARYNYADVNLWIDALCIDQTDIAERGRQVQMMIDIYMSGRMTVVWLGHTSPNGTSYSQCPVPGKVDAEVVLTDVSSWFELFRDSLAKLNFYKPITPPRSWYETFTLLSQDDIDLEITTILLHLAASLLNDDRLASVWYIGSRLYAHVYFTRMWVIQEIFSSPELELVFGKLKMRASEVFPLLWFIYRLGMNMDREEASHYWQSIAESAASTTDSDVASPSPPGSGFRGIQPVESYYQRLLGILPPNMRDSDGPSRLSDDSLVTMETILIERLKVIILELVNCEKIISDHFTDDLFGRWIDPNSRPIRKFDLPDLLSNYGMFQCSEVVDKVYALAGLCSESFPIHIDYGIGPDALYFRICDLLASVASASGSEYEHNSGFMSSLDVKLLDLMMGDENYRNRTMIKKLICESEVEKGSPVHWSTVLYEKRTIYKISDPTRQANLFHAYGICECCSRAITFSYDPRSVPIMGYVIVQCFQASHVMFAFDLDDYGDRQLGFFTPVDVDRVNEGFRPSLPELQIWTSSEQGKPLPLSSALKEVILFCSDWYRCILTLGDKDDDESIADHLIAKFSGWPDFVASEKISRSMLEKMDMKPETLERLIQQLEEESYFDEEDAEETM